MTNKVTITVTGAAGSGKSAITDMLFEFLSDMNFVTAQVDTDSTDFRSGMSQKTKDLQLEHIKGNTVIVIDEKQKPRGSL